MLNKEILNNFVKYDGDSLKLLFIYLYIYSRLFLLSLTHSFIRSFTLSMFLSAI